MTHHRPHPLTGPWPYDLAPTADVDEPPPLVDRVPTPDSRVYADPDDAILYDGCDRCAQHAANPLSALDPDKTAALWSRMIEVERDPAWRAAYRTATEAQACYALYAIAVWVQRTNPGVNPWTWPWTGSLPITGPDGTVV